MAEYDDHELERRVRASLDQHADEVDTTVPLRIGARSHRRRWVALGAAAAAAVVAAVAAVTVPVVLLGDRTPTPTRPAPALDLPAQWRTEYWHGISVDVPAGWTWGAGPMRETGHVLRCGGPDAGTPYVGRPIYLSDLCIGGATPDPTAPYVWFDAPLDPGVVELDHGYVQVTVERDDSTVTVGSDDEALRDRILSSVAGQDLCPGSMSLGEDSPSLANVDGQVPESFDLLRAYTRSDPGGMALVYGRELDAGDYRRWERATDEAGTASPDCAGVTDVVVVTARFADAARTWQLLLPCGPVRAGDARISMTSDMDRIWLDGGLRRTLTSYIGPLG